MRRLLTVTAIAALTLAALTTSAQAGGGKSGGGSQHSQHSRGHGQKFTGHKHGNHWRFHGREGHYWSRTRWSKRYGCECYYCPTTCGWYYWCAPQSCYMPVSCYQQYPSGGATATATASASASAAAGR
jgi:hypothetical protein